MKMTRPELNGLHPLLLRSRADFALFIYVTAIKRGNPNICTAVAIRDFYHLHGVTNFDFESSRKIVQTMQKEARENRPTLNKQMLSVLGTEAEEIERYHRMNYKQ